MKKFHFQIPERILHLVELKIWPLNSLEAKFQNTKSFVNEELISKIAPDESSIYFSGFESFDTLENEFSQNYEFWVKEGAINEINPKNCIVIGDFGLGSDAPIVLDYSNNPSNPSVKRLVWGKQKNYWEKIADNIDELLNKLEFGINAT